MLCRVTSNPTAGSTLGRSHTPAQSVGRASTSTVTCSYTSASIQEISRVSALSAGRNSPSKAISRTTSEFTLENNHFSALSAGRASLNAVISKRTSIRTGEKPHHCPDYGRRFTHRSTLNMHKCSKEFQMCQSTLYVLPGCSSIIRDDC